MPNPDEVVSPQEAAKSVETVIASLAETGKGRAVEQIGATIETRYRMYETVVKKADALALPQHTEGLNTARARLAESLPQDDIEVWGGHYWFKIPFTHDSDPKVQVTNERAILEKAALELGTPSLPSSSITSRWEGTTPNSDSALRSQRLDTRIPQAKLYYDPANSGQPFERAGLLVRDDTFYQMMYDIRLSRVH